MAEKDILTELRGKGLWITLNRPKKYNAITKNMFFGMNDILKEVLVDDKVSYVVITGARDSKFHSSGSDFSPAELSDLQDSAPQSHGYKVFIDTLIGYTKPVIAVISGHAYGVSVTMLGVMDMVISIDTATFKCPFAEIGVCPEAASSTSIVATMGHQKASALMLFAETFTAQEAYQAGLVTKILPAKTFEADLVKLFARYDTLSPFSMVVGKKLMRHAVVKDALYSSNRKEEIQLDNLFASEDTIERLTAKFVKPASKI